MTLPPRRLHRWEGVAVESWRQQWNVPRLRVYRSIASTNTLAQRLAAHGAPAGTTVIAEYQSAGRGRRGSAWHAPAGQALLLSTIARAPRLRDHGGGPASVRAGLLVARAIEDATGLEARLKWPNDVLAPDDRKIAGLLCEGVLGNGGFLVVGVGVNLLQRAHEFPPALRATATSIVAAGGRAVPRAALAEAILGAILRVGDIAAPLADDELRALRRRDALRGAPLTVDGTAAGSGDGVAADGALRVRTPAGTRLVYSGTVRRAPDGTAAHSRERTPAQRAPHGGRSPC